MCHNQPIQLTPDTLLRALQGELDAIAHLKQLHQMAPDPQDEALLREIHNEKAKHANAFAEQYRRMTGVNPPETLPREAAVSSYRAGVREAMLQALRDSEFYRCVYLHCDNMMPRLFFDAMEDETKHAILLNHLYAKTLEACCEEGGEVPGEPACPFLAHTVQEGESLWQIAQQHTVTLEELLAANPQITDPAVLYVGQVVCIPCAGSTYLVQPGDSLWQIARQHGVTLEDLQAANPQVTDPAAIREGQPLCIPASGGPAPCQNRESLTYLYGGTDAAYLRLLDATGGAVRTACPDFFSLDENGGLLLASSDRLNTDFISQLHSRGILVTPFLSNNWNRETGSAALSSRERLTSQLAAAVEQYNLDGVNFDIENVTEQYRDAYVDLARLMREKLPAGKTVAVAVAANPNGWTTGWHGSYDYAGLARYCDYLVIMGYDESYQGGPEGPVASGPFFENSIRYALQQGVPKEQVVAAIPFFGRYWKEGEAAGGVGLADRDVEYLQQSYAATAGYDENTMSAYAAVTIRPGEPDAPIWGGRVMTPGVYHIWYDSLEATRYKLDLISRYDLRGAGSWALGQENPAVWDFYTMVLDDCETPCAGCQNGIRPY